MQIISVEELLSIIKNRKLHLENALKIAEKIIEDVKRRGDSALIYYTEKFDKVKLKEIRLDEEYVEEAVKNFPDNIIESFKVAFKNIMEFHSKQFIKGYEIIRHKSVLGIKSIPIDRVGFYIPGGKKSYPSTLLMLAAPARVAGVKEIAVTSPPKNGKISNEILLACYISGIKEIYCIGGVQAIAALAYGTESVRNVHKIFGPGNIYVTAAKILISKDVPIDLIAGPSEIVIVADGSANPEYIALDLLAQAEHDFDAFTCLITDSKDLIERVKIYIDRYKNLSEIAKESIEKGYIVYCNDLEKIIDVVNEIAPEHLEIIHEKSDYIFERIKNAGNIFIGENSPVALGDYITGTNHVLPTMGFAKSMSSVNVLSFLKFIQYQKISREFFEKYARYAIEIANLEGMILHKKSLEIRFLK